jgi:large subunit ribosomal protein L10
MSIVYLEGFLLKFLREGGEEEKMASAKIIEKKKQQVIELCEKIKNAQVVVMADYRGITVEEDTNLRAEMRSAGVEYKVIKNNLTRHAMETLGIKGMDEYLVGPTAIAFGVDDPVSPAKILAKFAKSCNTYEIKAGILEGQVVDVSEINNLASLPSKEELIAQMLGGLNAPITGLVYVLNANITGLARALNAIAEQKGQEAS